jgi:extracellular elastinolytic metalloproteinase
MVRAIAATEAYLGSDASRVQLDPHVQETLAGEQVVHGRQQRHGIAVYPHSIVFRVSPDGTVTHSGHSFADVSNAQVIPALTAPAAVRRAYQHVRNGTGEICHTPHEPLLTDIGYRPSIYATFSMPSRPTVLTRGPFAKAPQAKLVITRDSGRLGWLVSMYVRGKVNFNIVIAATGRDAGALLYCGAEAASVVCTANVYRFNPAFEPAVEVTFPRPLSDYPANLQNGAFTIRDWVDQDRTLGNNVETLFGNQTPKLRLTLGGSKDKQFVSAVGSADEQVVNAFFLCNFAHDFFALLGFGEKEGNFQQKNFSHAGAGGDRLLLNIINGATGDANMQAQEDGSAAELTLGMFATPGGRSTALDADVVLHEYTHGVSQRLVGGRQDDDALVEPQSLALGEAWSDYFAVTIQNFYRQNDQRFAFAAYASNIEKGVRPTQASPTPYNLYTHDTGNFGRLGTPPFNEQHAAGSIFAAALIEMQRQLCAILGFDAGHVAGWRLVVASLKTVPGNPTFIDARGEILKAVPLLNLDTASITASVRDAFAKFGIGSGATCVSTSFSGVHADFNP